MSRYHQQRTHTAHMRCCDCDERIKTPLRLPGSVQCPCGSWFRLSMKPGDPRLLVQREEPGDMLPPGSTQEDADHRGRLLTKVMQQQAEVRALTRELYRRYKRDCEANGLTHKEIPDA